MRVLPAAAPADVRSRVFLFIDAAVDVCHGLRRSPQLSDQQSFAELLRKESDIARGIDGEYTLFALFTRFENTLRHCLSSFPATTSRKRFTPDD